MTEKFFTKKEAKKIMNNIISERKTINKKIRKSADKIAKKLKMGEDDTNFYIDVLYNIFSNEESVQLAVLKNLELDEFIAIYNKIFKYAYEEYKEEQEQSLFYREVHCLVRAFIDNSRDAINENFNENFKDVKKEEQDKDVVKPKVDKSEEIKETTEEIKKASKSKKDKK